MYVCVCVCVYPYSPLTQRDVLSPAGVVDELMTVVASIGQRHKQKAECDIVNLDCPFALEPSASTLTLLNDTLQLARGLLKDATDENEKGEEKEEEKEDGKGEEKEEEKEKGKEEGKEKEQYISIAKAVLQLIGANLDRLIKMNVDPADVGIHQSSDGDEGPLSALLSNLFDIVKSCPHRGLQTAAANAIDAGFLLLYPTPEVQLKFLTMLLVAHNRAGPDESDQSAFSIMLCHVMVRFASPKLIVPLVVSAQSNLSELTSRLFDAAFKHIQAQFEAATAVVEDEEGKDGDDSVSVTPPAKDAVKAETTPDAKGKGDGDGDGEGGEAAAKGSEAAADKSTDTATESASASASTPAAKAATKGQDKTQEEGAEDVDTPAATMAATTQLLSAYQAQMLSLAHTDGERYNPLVQEYGSRLLSHCCKVLELVASAPWSDELAQLTRESAARTLLPQFLLATVLLRERASTLPSVLLPQLLPLIRQLDALVRRVPGYLRVDQLLREPALRSIRNDRHTYGSGSVSVASKFDTLKHSSQCHVSEGGLKLTSGSSSGQWGVLDRVLCEGIWTWEMQVGATNKDAGFGVLMGEVKNKSSYPYSDKKLFMYRNTGRVYRRGVQDPTKRSEFGCLDRVKVVLDLHAGTLAFGVNGATPEVFLSEMGLGVTYSPIALFGSKSEVKLVSMSHSRGSFNSHSRYQASPFHS